MSPLSRNPRDATIQLRDIQRWGRCRGSLRGRSHGRHVHRPSLDRWLALTGISFGSVLLCPPVRGPGGPLRGYGLVRSRRPDQLLASCPGGRSLRGYDLVRSRRPEHGIEHAEQLPGHRHDGPLLTAAMHQPREQGSPFRAVADQPPGGLHQCPPQQSRAFPW